jgi:SusD/RagB-like outer membrane lipoprotein
MIMKMKIGNKNMYSGLFLLLVITCLPGCKKQLNINQNPNFPTLSEGTPALVFPVGVLATAGQVGGNLATVGGMYAQYFTQAALAQQYVDIESYNLISTDAVVNISWDNLFADGLENYKFVTDHAAANGDWNFYLMATVMKAYTAEVLVDLYDQIPYSEALQGASNLTPKFDSGYSVYTSLLNSLDTALSKDFTASTNTLAGKQDLVFGGNIGNWQAFANTLKLKMYLRMTNAHPDVAQAGIQALYNAGASFLTTDASVTNFADIPGNDNPLYEFDIRSNNTATNLKASTTFVSWLEANNDPRIVYWFGSTTPASINQGDFSNINPVYSAAPTFAITPTDPVEFLSLPECYFLQAEADLRYLGGSNAQGLYNQGVLTAFAQLGLDGSSFIASGGAYAYPATGTVDQKLQAIIVQKWASCAYGDHGLEAFFEQNRTGYPLRSAVYSTDPSYIPGQLVISKNSDLPAGEVPKRMVFPYNETSRNPNAPTPVPETTPVWWGK